VLTLHDTPTVSVRRPVFSRHCNTYIPIVKECPKYMPQPHMRLCLRSLPSCRQRPAPTAPPPELEQKTVKRPRHPCLHAANGRPPTALLPELERKTVTWPRSQIGRLSLGLRHRHILGHRLRGHHMCRRLVLVSVSVFACFATFVSECSACFGRQLPHNPANKSCTVR